VILVVVFVAAATAIAVRSVNNRPVPQGAVHVPITNLPDIVATQRDLLKQATDEYTPTVPGRIDDFSVSAVNLLRQLPLRPRVDALLAPHNPTHRIVQFRDWHYVPKDLYSLDLRAAAGKALTKTEVDLHLQEFLLQVELVQLEQMALLRCLIKYHGLKRVYIERFTPEQMPGMHERIAALREAEPHQATLKEQFKEAQAFVQKLAAGGKAGTERFIKATDIERELASMLEHHQLDMLDIGAAGRLLVAGELQDIQPLDDAKLLEAAKPSFVDGKVAFDAARVARRHEAMVQFALSKDHMAVIVLGGMHDLRDAVRLHNGDTCEYIRVTVPAFLKFAGEDGGGR